MTLCHGPSPSHETSVLHVASLRCCHAAFAAVYHSPVLVWGRPWALTPSAGALEVFSIHFQLIATHFLQQHQSCWALVTAALCSPSLCPSSSTPAPSQASSFSASCLSLQILTSKPWARQKAGTTPWKWRIQSDLKSRTNLHPCICHGEPNATEGGGSIS